MADEHLRMTALVSGRVQGVGYRHFVRQQAYDLALTGYAENLSDGRVEVVAEGDRATLELLLLKLKRGPAHALVEAIDISWGQASNLQGFYTY